MCQVCRTSFMTIFYNKPNDHPMVVLPSGTAIGTMADEKSETFFVGKDVAEVLGFTAPRNAIAAHVEGMTKRMP